MRIALKNYSSLLVSDKKTPWIVVVQIMATVIVVEVLIMLALPFMLTEISKTGYALADALLLALIISPVLYYTMVIPLQQKSTLEERMRNQLHDSLTGLPKEPVFREMLEHEISAAKRGSYRISLISIDPARLAEINQVISYEAGDMILKQISERIRSACRESDVVSRISGDEFAIMLPCSNFEQVKVIEAKIRAVIDEPFMINNGTRIDINAVSGIAVYPDHASDAVSLIKHANMAMKRAKSEKIATAIYDESDDPSIHHRFKIFGELRAALLAGELELYYQPKMGIKLNTVKCVEALIRWTGEHGRPPSEFIPLAEETGLIDDITMWVMEQAVLQCKQWLDQGLHITVSVNVSVRNLIDGNLTKNFVSACAIHHVPASFIMIEVTESSVMLHPEIAIDRLNELRKAGFGVSLDDFGTGYSSLAYLKHIPATELKLDRSFVIGICHNHNDKILVESVIHLARKLGLVTVAEGVESKDTVIMLRQLGCDMIQGYYYSPPLEASSYLQWHNQWHKNIV